MTKIFDAAFLQKMEKVKELEVKLDQARVALQEICPHAYPNGRSAFPHGISFTDCELCGQSSYHARK